MISSLLRTFPEDFSADGDDHVPVDVLPIPKILDIRDGVARYDEAQARKQPDWTYAPA